MRLKMVNMEKAQKEFLNYSSKFSTQNSTIQMKIGHSIRVMKISKKLADELKLNEEETELATLIGLLHDIGRFEQYTEHKTYQDHKSINHGKLGVEILEKNQYIRKYIETPIYDEIIKKAILNHNGYQLPKDLNQKEKLFCQIIKDSDKIDILYEGNKIFWIGREEMIAEANITKEVMQQFLEGKLVKNEVKNTQIDHLIGMISYIYDIYFKETFKYIKENNYIEGMIDRFDFKQKKTKEDIEKIRKIAGEFIEQKIK